MLKAVEMADALGAPVWLADRDIRATLSRAWHALGWWSRIKLVYQLLLSMGAVEDITEEEIERMKQQDVLETLLAEVGRSMPMLKTVLIDERDRYLAAKIRQAPGKKVVAVVGAGHLPGILAHWNEDTDLSALEALPPPGKLGAVMKWSIPASIVALFVAGFFFGGKEAGTDMIVLWSLCTGLLAGLGAALALAHPATILSSVVVAPFTTLHPMIAAGWVSGLVEAFSRKPKVKDLESLPEDILSFRGFWRNNVTRILLVVAFTNLGASVGTLVAFPVIVKILLGGPQ
jgi:pheromone shutdown-related protein TraB